MSIAKYLIPEISKELGFVSIDNNFNFTDALQVVNDSSVKTLQTNKPVDNHIWSLINEVILPVRPDLKIRIYGHYSDVCDLAFLKNLTNVHNLSIDGILESKSIEIVAELNNLSSLKVDVYDIKNFDFLVKLRGKVSNLSIGKTKSKKPNLEFLHEFTFIKSLSICGHSKGIEVLRELRNLHTLSLKGLTVNNLHFLNPLNKLLSLYIDLIKCEDLYSMSDLKIKTLGVSEIRNLEDLSFISELSDIQNLDLSCLNKVQCLPELSCKNQVRRIFIDNMKSLTNINNIYECQNLIDFIFKAESTPLSVNDFEPLSRLNNLKYATIGTGSVKKNAEIVEVFKNSNISRYSYYDFEYE